MNPLGQTLGNRLVEQLAPRIFTPAFAFWAGGLLVLWSAGYGRSWPGLLAALPVVPQLALMAAAVALVAGSAVVVEHLTLPVLRFLEGYSPVTRPLRALAVRRQTRADQRLQSLTAAAYRGEAVDLGRLAAAEQRAHDSPASGSLLPTRLGNILRAAEDRPRDRYGLDPVVCWPHLWLSLDKETQEELTAARKALDDGARLWLWFLLFAGWSWAAWWAPVVTVLGCALTYYGTLLTRARSYGLLTQAAFDLYRRRIYQALGWPFPKNAHDERAHGGAVTMYLWRGIAPPDLTYTEEH